MAFKWWVAMHREALYLVTQAALHYNWARTADNSKKRLEEVERAEKLLCAALHHEAHGLHSLTDLYASGHINVDRINTADAILTDNRQMAAPFVLWMAKALEDSFPSDLLHAGGSDNLKPLRAATTNSLDTTVGDTPYLLGKSKAEQNMHAVSDVGLGAGV